MASRLPLATPSPGGHPDPRDLRRHCAVAELGSVRRLLASPQSALPMPSFFQSGRFHGVSYITGPAHVCLQVAFVSQPTPEPELVALSPIGSCSHGLLDPQRVRSAVVEAATETNRKLGSAFHPAAIAYVPNDSPRYELFGHCATLLIRRLACGEEFGAVSS